MAIRGIERLKRVIWRLQEDPKEFYSKKDIEKAIMMECGIDHRTIASNFGALKKLEWIKCDSQRWYIQNKDYF